MSFATVQTRDWRNLGASNPTAIEEEFRRYLGRNRVIIQLGTPPVGIQGRVSKALAGINVCPKGVLLVSVSRACARGISVSSALAELIEKAFPSSRFYTNLSVMDRVKSVLNRTETFGLGGCQEEVRKVVPGADIVRDFRACLYKKIDLLANGRREEAEKLTPFLQLFSEGFFPAGILDNGAFLVLIK